MEEYQREAIKEILHVPHPVLASTESMISLENLSSEEFKSYNEFLYVHGFPPDWLDIQDDYTRCPDCGQYTCVCQDEPDDSCHCEHPDCGAC